MSIEKFKAYRIHSDKNQTRAGFETLSIADLTPGDVIIRCVYSCINYKDALAATGKGRILRKSPLNGGIDFAGIVESSSNNQFKPGDKVLAAGTLLSEELDGGYSEYLRLPAASLVPLPAGLSLWESMALGTAGFTAALAIQRLLENQQTPELGPILVTGASGGVGSFAINLLAGLGYKVTALSRKKEQHDYLKQLGATDVMHPDEIEDTGKPLQAARWGGAIDNLGGKTLSYLTRSIAPFGNIASIGLAQGIELNTTVMPFILRGNSLLGINCVYVRSEQRTTLWQALGQDLKPTQLKLIANRSIEFADLEAAFNNYIDGHNIGRTVVKIGEE